MSYQVKVENSSTSGYTYALYQVQPDEKNSNLAWKTFDLAKPTPTVPTTGGSEWSLDYIVTVPLQSDGVYTINDKVPGLLLPAKPGLMYSVVTVNNVTTMTPVGPGKEGHITITNLTTGPLDLGIGMSETLLAIKKQVQPSQSADFEILTNYYLGVYKYESFKQGAVLDYKFALGPVLIKFVQGYTVANVQTIYENGEDQLTTPSYSYIAACSLLP